MTPEQTLNALQRIAREQGRAVQELLTLYVLERFLARLVESSHADSFVLKGGGRRWCRVRRDPDAHRTDSGWRRVLGIAGACQSAAPPLGLSQRFSAATLRKAIEEVAEHRNVELSTPSASLAGHDDLAQQKWAVWRTKTDVEDLSLAVLGDQLVEVSQIPRPDLRGRTRRRHEVGLGLSGVEVAGQSMNGGLWSTGKCVDRLQGTCSQGR